jgi:hypothetical protein
MARLLFSVLTSHFRQLKLREARGPALKKQTAALYTPPFFFLVSRLCFSGLLDRYSTARNDQVGDVGVDFSENDLVNSINYQYRGPLLTVTAAF